MNITIKGCVLDGGMEVVWGTDGYEVAPVPIDDLIYISNLSNVHSYACVVDLDLLFFKI
jgi:hypothetical protein